MNPAGRDDIIGPKSQPESDHGVCSLASYFISFVLAVVVMAAAQGPAAEPQAPNTAALNGQREQTAVIEQTTTSEPRDLSAEESAILDAHYWDEWVGDSLAVWVSVEEQMFRIIEDRTVLWEAPCATAEKGTGFIMNSMQTPLGWHSIKRKIGDDAPWGQVFKGAQPINRVWKPGDDTEEDLVLTRLLWLTGEEPGVNQGGNVDSYNRYIYIHKTNDEERIGTPSSHGCVRLRNDDVIEVYELIPLNARVLITETKTSGTEK